jgi:hypothetical protein
MYIKYTTLIISEVANKLLILLYMFLNNILTLNVIIMLL